MNAESNNKKHSRKYAALRAAFIERGTTLRAWAATAGLPVSTVYGAARGDRSGVRAVAIRRQLEEFAYAK